jgi:hypothetical protein
MFNPATLQKLQQDSNHEFVQRYLNLVPELRALNPESAFLVISMAKDPLVIRKALTVLIQGSDQRGLEILQSYLNQGKISEEEAAQILLVNPDFALPFVEKMEDTPVRSRLLGYLTEKTPNPDLVIRKGYWVLCEAGWGKITAISNANSTEYFLLDQEKPILQVSLRDGIPQSDVIFPERAQVDLTTNEIKLIGRKAGYICQTCNRFITSAGKATWDKHSLATQHEGNFFPIRFPYLMKGAPRYFIDPPKEVFSDK